MGFARSAELTTKPSSGDNRLPLLCFQLLNPTCSLSENVQYKMSPFSEQIPSAPYRVASEREEGRKFSPSRKVGLRSESNKAAKNFSPHF